MGNNWNTGEPEKEGFYLITYGNSGEKAVAEAYYHPGYVQKWFKHGFRDTFQKFIADDITHWMPMPSPAED